MAKDVYNLMSKLPAPSRRRLRGVAAPMAAALWLAAAPAASAAQAPERGRYVTASLPESNEARLLASRVHESVERGDFRLAIQLVEQIMELPDDLVAGPDGATYYPVRRQARELLADLPPEGIAVYRRLYDAEVTARSREAAAAGDLEALGALFDAHPISSVSGEMGRALAAALIEDGRYSSAIEVLHEMDSHSQPMAESFANHARRAIALAKLGAWQAAYQVLRALGNDQKIARVPGAPQKLQRLGEWLDKERPSIRVDAERILRPFISDTLVWESSLPNDLETDFYASDAAIADAIHDFRRLPQVRPLLSGDSLIVRARGVVSAFDWLTLTPRWREPEFVSGDASWRQTSRFAQPVPSGRTHGITGSTLSDDARRLLLHPLRHAISIGHGNVYSVESVPMLTERDVVERRRQRWWNGRLNEPTYPNELVARRLEDGSLVWRIGHLGTDPLHGVTFLDAPVAVGKTLAVPIRRSYEIHLAVLDPASGRLIRELPIVGPPTLFHPQGGRCLISADSAGVYIATGNGVVAALSGTTWKWKWAAVYPGTLGEQLTARTPFRQVRPRSTRMPPSSRPLIAGDLLLVAPDDSLDLIAFDRFTGKRRWRVDRSGMLCLIGTIADSLITAGNTIVAVDLADGKTVRWRSLPLEVTGRPLLHQARVYVPTRNGMIVIDGANGKIVADGRPPAGVGAVVGGYVLTPDALLSVSPNRVIKYPDLSSANTRLRAAVKQDRAGPREWLALAWLKTLEGDYDQALSNLKAMDVSDGALAAARESLLASIFLSLSRDATEGHNKLVWLRRAEQLAATPTSAGRLAALIGAALEQEGRTQDALQHYRRMLLARSSGVVLDDAGGRMAGWLFAAARIRTVLRAMSPDERAAELLRLVNSVAAGDALAEILERQEKDAGDPFLRERRGQLFRVREAARGHAGATAILDRALLLLRPQPELAITLLPSSDDPELPLALRRRLHLERWETHAALGMVRSAEADERRWQTEFAPDPGEDGAAASPEAARDAAQVKGNLASTRKLRKDAAFSPEYFSVDFDASPTWKLDREKQWRLVVGARGEALSPAGRVLVLNETDYELELRSVNRGMRLRRTPALTSGQTLKAQLNDESARRFMVGGRGERGDRATLTWPAILHGHMAVVPVRGGLVCVGLGPERRAGNRIWEYAIADAFNVAGDFTARAVAGPYGFCFAPREDRLLSINWSNGELRWRHDLDDFRISRIFSAGDDLVLVSVDGHVLVLDGEFGDNPRTPPPSLSAPSEVHVVDGVLLLALDRSIHALRTDTMETLWQRRCASQITEWRDVANTSWVAYNAPESNAWTVLKMDASQVVGEVEIRDLGRLTALARVGPLLLVAGMDIDTTEGENEGRAVVRLGAFQIDTGEAVWRVSIPSEAAVNTSQLTAHPDLIPVLVAGSSARDENIGQWNSERAFAIHFVEKKSGKLLSRRAITAGLLGDRRRGRRVPERGFLLATPTKLIVQAGDGAAAFGKFLSGGGRANGK